MCFNSLSASYIESFLGLLISASVQLSHVLIKSSGCGVVFSCQVQHPTNTRASHAHDVSNSSRNL